MHQQPPLDEYRTMVESAPEAIIVYAGGRFLYVNEFAAARLRADRKSLIGHPIMEFVHPESVELVVTRLKQLEETGDASGPPIEVRFVARDGTVIPSEVVSVPVMFAGRQAMLTLIRDISRRLEAEQALRDSEERFGNAFRHSPHGMAFVSLDGHWLRANQALCDMVGYTEEELRGRTFKEISHPDDVPDDLEQVRAIIAGRQDGYSKIKRYYTKDGRIVWVSVNIFAARNREGAVSYFIGQVQDITRQRELEAEAAHGRWLAGIGDTAVAVAHEMNNALTILMMNAELLADTQTPTDESPAMAAEVLAAAKRIQATVDGLRRLADPQSIDYLGDKKMVDLSSLGVNARR